MYAKLILEQLFSIHYSAAHINENANIYSNKTVKVYIVHIIGALDSKAYG
jgi:hypothetical protein